MFSNIQIEYPIECYICPNFHSKLYPNFKFEVFGCVMYCLASPKARVPFLCHDCICIVIFDVLLLDKLNLLKFGTWTSTIMQFILI
jgi:hypothetical protein